MVVTGEINSFANVQYGLKMLTYFATIAQMFCNYFILHIKNTA